MRRAMALASKTPIQIGRNTWPPCSRSTTMGMLEVGSSISPLISMRTRACGSAVESVSLIAPFYAPLRGALSDAGDDAQGSTRHRSSDGLSLVEAAGEEAVVIRAVDAHGH